MTVPPDAVAAVTVTVYVPAAEIVFLLVQVVDAPGAKEADAFAQSIALLPVPVMLMVYGEVIATPPVFVIV